MTSIQQKVGCFARLVCDPVLGDDGRLYVPADIVPLMRDVLVPLADLVLPNQFELEYVARRATPDFDTSLV